MAVKRSRGRGERAGLTRNQICDAAIDVMDDGGLEAVTIRTVAARLRVHPSALYNHVRDKDDLVDAMTTRCFRALPSIDPERPVAGELRAVFRAWRDLGVRHPGLLYSTAAGRWRVIEDVQSALRRAGLESEEITSTFVALMTVTIGSAVITADFEAIGGEDQLRQRLAAEIESLPPDDYPTVRDRAATLSSSASLDDQFERQLDLVLAPLASANT